MGELRKLDTPITLHEFRDISSSFCDWMIGVLSKYYGVSVVSPTIMCNHTSIKIGSRIPIETAYAWHLLDDGPAVSIYFGLCAANNWWYRVEIASGRYQGPSLESVQESIMLSIDSTPDQLQLPG